ncbi:gp242 [Bacillus phage G]|uniref:Gp242 n=1 Tax=Bacillus phage G TaxID=2884420 RepID=G3M9Y3_9CAUD|nr:gp242 [Bacillus phage G]AEO93501.1 gp242 [Bacillus phage G]
MNLTNKKIIRVMAGLPGSGKTTLANKFKAEQRRNLFIWNIDKYSRRNELSGFFREIHYDFDRYKYHVLDGLFLSNDDYAKLIDHLMRWDSIGKNGNVEFEFYYFEPDIEACVWNDRARGRSENAFVTIKNALVEKPDLEQLVKLTNYPIRVIDCTVQRADEFEVYYNSFKEHFNFYNDYLLSESWSKGGNWCDCWGSDVECDYEEDPDLLPENFDGFIELMNNILPEMDEKLKKELFDFTVDYYEDSESDYYGGTQHHKYFRCDLKELYRLLEEKELLILSMLLDQ